MKNILSAIIAVLSFFFFVVFVGVFISVVAKTVDFIIDFWF